MSNKRFGNQKGKSREINGEGKVVDNIFLGSIIVFCLSGAILVRCTLPKIV